MTDSLDIIVHYSSKVVKVSYDCINEDVDLDILKSQVFSMIDDDFTEILLLDYSGVLLSTSHDLSQLISNMKSDITSNNDTMTIAKMIPDIWCLPTSFIQCDSCYDRLCMKKETPTEEDSMLQYQYRMIDTTYRLCHHCRLMLDASLLDSSATDLACYTCDSSTLADMGMILPSTVSRDFSIDLPVELYMRRYVYEEAIKIQEVNIQLKIVKIPSYAAHTHQKRQEFLQILKSGHDVVRTYEDKAQQQTARSVINYAKIIGYYNTFQQDHPHTAADIALLHAMLQWFKCDHFKWTNKPPCSNPACITIISSPHAPQNMNSLGMTSSSEEERVSGWTSRVELYQCQYCQHQARFPRCNNPSYLLTTSPRGRCGEFANAFGLVCRSMGFDVRYVRDLTDHVWVEIWLPSLQRYVHADACERALDTPLLYESGWGKKLTYIISFSRYGVIEASAKYSRCMNEVIMRRQGLEYGEAFVLQAIQQQDVAVRSAFISSSAYMSKVVFNNDEDRGNSSADFSADRYIEALHVGAVGYRMMAEQELSREKIEQRTKSVALELERMSFLEKSYVKLEELQGRISGSLEWRAMRGELGANPDPK